MSAKDVWSIRCSVRVSTNGLSHMELFDEASLNEWDISKVVEEINVNGVKLVKLYLFLDNPNDERWNKICDLFYAKEKCDKNCKWVCNEKCKKFWKEMENFFYHMCGENLPFPVRL